ncbi:hypothetical protein B2J93_1170 [Marssonina coronariae]|uniref:Uncharacterized protein n=1 Tax=Diplocarpon coronariae TaxID=2795749 RepID=A0A218YV06_9HELO|nr:hypothetical protein B2J93_1170 [Marssonina coronariae]
MVMMMVMCKSPTAQQLGKSAQHPTAKGKGEGRFLGELSDLPSLPLGASTTLPHPLLAPFSSSSSSSLLTRTLTSYPPSPPAPSTAQNEDADGKSMPLAAEHAPMARSASTPSAESASLARPSAPVVIPRRGQQLHPSHDRSRHGKRERRPRDNQHSPDAIPPAVAALLALTAIPPQRGRRPQNGPGQRLTVDAILEHTRVAEEQRRIALGKSSLDVLLSPPGADGEVTESDAGYESVLSSRTISSESVPSLEDDGSVSEASPSFGSPTTPGNGARGRRPARRRMQSLPLPLVGPADSHPLAEGGVDGLDFGAFQKPQQGLEEPQQHPGLEPRRRSAFTSNLTASLRALRSAARSLSSLTTPMVTPDDFLTRSIISVNPQVPFTDERMPRLEDTPTPALRRYLNPTTNAPSEAHISASIQMQTYKVSRSGRARSTNVISRRIQPSTEDVVVVTRPLVRQRDMRENSDFIRVAVMEMLMRKRGKLDDQKPGRARWALPPRKPSGSYEISGNGVPARWIAITY